MTKAIPELARQSGKGHDLVGESPSSMKHFMQR
jgi:hypothetical protein